MLPHDILLEITRPLGVKSAIRALSVCLYRITFSFDADPFTRFAKLFTTWFCAVARSGWTVSSA